MCEIIELVKELLITGTVGVVMILIAVLGYYAVQLIKKELK